MTYLDAYSLNTTDCNDSGKTASAAASKLACVTAKLTLHMQVFWSKDCPYLAATVFAFERDVKLLHPWRAHALLVAKNVAHSVIVRLRSLLLKKFKRSRLGSTAQSLGHTLDDGVMINVKRANITREYPWSPRMVETSANSNRIMTRGCSRGQRDAGSISSHESSAW